MSEQVGFLGVGKIGRPMARRLLDHGHRLHVFDVVPAAREPFRAIPGASVCGSVTEVVERAGTIFLATQDKFPRAVLTRTFDDGFAVEHMLRDVSLFGELAAGLQVPTFICREVIEMWRLAASRGLGLEDFTNLVRILEEWAAVKIGPVTG